jgi:recombinational DNA repair ATPase RecF
LAAFTSVVLRLREITRRAQAIEASTAALSTSTIVFTFRVFRVFRGHPDARQRFLDHLLFICDIRVIRGHINERHSIHQ